jgi:murein DD-endopeptidase MepM/ murein hydrolase activator NlpD
MRNKIIAIFVSLTCLLSFTAMPALAVTTDDLNNAVQSVKNAQYQVDTTKKTIAGISSEIAKSDAAIASLEAQMATTKEKVAEAEAKRAQQEAELEERIRVMYMYGDEGYLEVLFSAKDFTELLTRLDQVRSVMQSDKDKVTALEATKNEIEAGIAEQEAQEAGIQSIKDQQSQLLAQNQTLLAQQQAEYDAEYAAGDAIAKQLGYAGLNGIIQTGDYWWPIDTNLDRAFYISDVFGNRSVAATNGVGSTNHQGIDITPGEGVEIHAIADGTVEIASYYGGYGNCVVLNNGTNTSGVKIGSLYGHMSSIAVSVGQTVKKGDVLGIIGSTGNSTGTHLHLSITENGQFVDPMNYFPQYANNYVYVN